MTAKLSICHIIDRGYYWVVPGASIAQINYFSGSRSWRLTSRYPGVEIEVASPGSAVLVRHLGQLHQLVHDLA